MKAHAADVLYLKQVKRSQRVLIVTLVRNDLTKENIRILAQAMKPFDVNLLVNSFS